MMATPKPSIEDERDFDRADTPTRERPHQALSTINAVNYDTSQSPASLDSGNDNVVVPAEAQPAQGISPTTAGSSAIVNIEKGSNESTDPTNSVRIVRDAYRRMARVNRNSGHRRMRRYDNAFFDDPEDEEALQEHLHIKVEYRSSFQTLLQPENSGMRDAFLKGEYPFVGTELQKSKKGKQKKSKIKNDPQEMFLAVDRRLRHVIQTCFERCQWYICWLEKLILWYIHTTKSVLSRHATEPILENNGRFPPAPELPESLICEFQEDIMIEKPQCFFLRGKKSTRTSKEEFACPSIFLLLQLKDDSYMRLLSHGTCQFYKLRTKTMECKNCKKAIVVQVTKRTPYPIDIKFSEAVKENFSRSI